jgi:hypothetical protein
LAYFDRLKPSLNPFQIAENKPQTSANVALLERFSAATPQTSPED